MKSAELLALSIGALMLASCADDTPTGVGSSPAPEPSLPGPVRDLTFIGASESAVYAEWSPPDSTHIDVYEHRLFLGSTEVDAARHGVSYKPPSGRHGIGYSDLEYGAVYTIRIRALRYDASTDEWREGPWLERSTVAQDLAGPLPPTDLEALGSTREGHFWVRIMGAPLDRFTNRPVNSAAVRLSSAPFTSEAVWARAMDIREVQVSAHQKHHEVEFEDLESYGPTWISVRFRDEAGNLGPLNSFGPFTLAGRPTPGGLQSVQPSPDEAVHVLVSRTSEPTDQCRMAHVDLREKAIVERLSGCGTARSMDVPFSRGDMVRSYPATTGILYVARAERTGVTYPEGRQIYADWFDIHRLDIQDWTALDPAPRVVELPARIQSLGYCDGKLWVVADRTLYEFTLAGDLQRKAALAESAGDGTRFSEWHVMQTGAPSDEGAPRILAVAEDRRSVYWFRRNGMEASALDFGGARLFLSAGTPVLDWSEGRALLFGRLKSPPNTDPTQAPDDGMFTEELLIDLVFAEKASRPRFTTMSYGPDTEFGGLLLDSPVRFSYRSGEGSWSVMALPSWRYDRAVGSASR